MELDDGLECILINMDAWSLDFDNHWMSILSELETLTEAYYIYSQNKHSI
jgi:hypothetical protein